MIAKIYINRFLKAFVFCMVVILFTPCLQAQRSDDKPASSKKSKKNNRILYGQASFYANKFNGRKTATGEIFSQAKFTAACNVLPLGTWIKVTNLKNGKSITVRTNDRLHPNTRRLLDLTKAGAKQLGYVSRGLTRVKIEILDKKQSK